MKKVILASCIVLITTFSSPAQNKTDLVDKLSETSGWLDGYVVEKTITLNLSESMWKLMVDETKTPQGYRTCGRMADAFVVLSDLYGGTHLEQKCGFSVGKEGVNENKEGCKSIIDGWNGKYTLTVNAGGLQGSKDGFHLVNGYIMTVASFIHGANSYGYAPKTAKQNIIINADNKYKDVSVSWSADGSIATINAPGDVEVNEWDTKIIKPFIKAWTK
jgi:hypothetical protein